MGVVEEPVRANAWPCPAAGRSSPVPPTSTPSVVVVASVVEVVVTWAVTLGRIWIEGAGSTYRRVDVTVNVFPPVTGTVLRSVALASLLLAVAVMVRASRRASTVPPMGMWASYAAGAFWLLYSPGVIGASVVGAGLHGLQYLACVHRAEVDWAVERGERDLGTLWLSLVGGALAGGLLLSAWLPSFLDNSFASGATPGIYGSLIFIALNLHHYAIDAAIWRHDGPHLGRITKGPGSATPHASPALAVSPA